MESLFIQLSGGLYKSQFLKIGPYDWFCGPWSHMILIAGSSYFHYNESLLFDKIIY